MNKNKSFTEDGDPTPEYLDLLKRASAVRRYLATHPHSSYRDISAALFPMTIPIAWLVVHGYVNKHFEKVDGPPSRGLGKTTYTVRPIGSSIMEETDVPDPSAEEVGTRD